MNALEVIALLVGIQGVAVVWLCVERDHMTNRINRAMDRIKYLEYHADVKEST